MSDKHVYSKRPGTSGISGQLYETKLLSLILFRLQHDKNVEEFYLGSNVAEAGQFDDICFKVKTKESSKPLVVFLQAKHKENKEKRINFDNKDLLKYFNSYLNIRYKFGHHSSNVMFNDRFNEVDCHFVIYTNVKSDSQKMLKQRANHLDDLIVTSASGGSNLALTDISIDMLCKEYVKDEIRILAKKIFKHVQCSRSYLMINDTHIQRYHVLLAKHVYNVSEILKDSRICKIRDDLFDTTDEFLLVFKDEFSKLPETRAKSNVSERYLQNFLTSPSVETLQSVLGSYITYKNGRLCLIKDVPKHFHEQLAKINMPESAVNEAMLQATNMFTFPVDISFGNLDIKMKNPEKRSNHLVAVIKILVDSLGMKDKSLGNLIIIILDESVDPSYLRFLRSAVGNILVHDNITDLLKFADNASNQPQNVSILFNKLNEQILNLKDIRFDVRLVDFPKLQFISRHDKSLLNDFFQKLIFYTGQASLQVTDDILKEHIENHDGYLKTFNYRIKSDAILSQYHNIIQKWYMSPHTSNYLTKDSNMYAKIVDNVVDNALLNIATVIYMGKISVLCTFNSDAEKKFNHEMLSPNSITITETTILTVIKIIQILNSKKIEKFVIIDLKFILQMTINDFYTLLAELKSQQGPIIFICDELNNTRHMHMRLDKLVDLLDNKDTIKITNEACVDIVKEYFSNTKNLIHDTQHKINDMTKDTQSKVLNDTQVTFQGYEVPLSLLIDDNSIKFIEGKVLNKIVLNKTVDIGRTLVDSNYEDMKQLYVDRKMAIDENIIEVKSLLDLKENVVCFTAKPGMGKSTFLTHLSIKTKEIDPTYWILRINLIDYLRQFYDWHKLNVCIDHLQALKFICTFIVSDMKRDGKEMLSLVDTGEAVHLKEFSGDACTKFELRLFLYHYNNKKVIFLFDGFDEILPNYEETAVKFLNVLKSINKNKMWIASRSTKDSILQNHFGKIYKLRNIDNNDLNTYLNTFWTTHVQFTGVNNEVLKDIKEILDRLVTENLRNVFRRPLGRVFLSFILYLINNYPGIEVTSKWSEMHSTVTALLHGVDVEPESSDGKISGIESPLLAYLGASYYANQFTQVDGMKTFTSDLEPMMLYEDYVEKKFVKSCVEDRKLDVYNPYVISIIEKEVAKWLEAYKS